jgi:hypothetical protein
MLTVDLANERVALLPHRALYRPRIATLYVADTHWGKAATFRAHGIPLPDGDLAADLSRLSDALHLTAARRLIVLGDLMHARVGLTPHVIATVTVWRKAHAQVEIGLVPGNHDRAEGLPADWRITWLGAEVDDAGWRLAHDPADTGEAFGLHGHLHPAWPLNGQGRQQLTLPCFLQRSRSLVLPAFASFSGRSVTSVDDLEAVYVVSPTQVVRVR